MKPEKDKKLETSRNHRFYADPWLRVEYDDAIDNCVNSIEFPDFLQSKALHLRAKIRQVICEVVQREEKPETGEWYVIRDQQQIHVVNEPKTEPDIADAIKVCKSKI